MRPTPARSIRLGSSANTDGGYPLLVGGSPMARPISRCACATRVRLSTSIKTSLPWSRKYSAITCVRCAAFRRSTGEILAGAAITTDLASPSGPSDSWIKACTSRPRSPIRPITTTSALVKRVIIPSSTLLPTPDPATRPSRWPRPSVSKPLIALTPTSSTRSIVPRSMGLSGKPNKLSWSAQTGRGMPSSGAPCASITRPSSASPRSACPLSLSTRTEAPGPMPTGSEKGIKYKVLSAKPTTSASIRWPLVPSTTQHAPIGAIKPRASMRKPTRRTTVPLRAGTLWAFFCKSAMLWSTSAEKSNIAVLHADHLRVGRACRCGTAHAYRHILYGGAGRSLGRHALRMEGRMRAYTFLVHG